MVLTTEAMAAEAIKRHGLNETKVRVIPNYVLTEHFAPRQAGMPLAKPRLIFVGRLSREKNLPSLIEAIAGLDVELTLVGDGPMKGELIDQAKRQGAELKFLGARPHLELPELLKRSTIFVLPSFYEGHPKSLLEAMSAGLPVVGAASPGIRELIDHGRTGLLAEPNSDGLAQAVRKLIGDQNLADRLGRAAAEYARAKCSLERVARLELELIKELVA